MYAIKVVRYGAPFETNYTNCSEIYIGRPIYISDVQYLYPTSDIQYLTLARARARVRARARARAGISDV